MPYVIFSWLASVLFGTEAVLGKLTSKYSITNPWFFCFVWSLIVFVFTLPLAIMNNVGAPSEWGNLLMVSLFYALSGIVYTWLIFALDVTVLSPMWNFRTVFSVILGAIMLRQMLTPYQYILIGIIFIAGLLVNLDERLTLRSFFRWPIFIALVEMMIVALLGIYTNKSIATNGYWVTTIWSEGIGQVMLLILLPKFLKEIQTISTKQIGALSIMSLAGTTGMLAANAAYAGNVGIASTIISLPFSMVIALALSIFVPKLLEKHTLKIYAIRFSAAAVMIVSALKLTM